MKSLSKDKSIPRKNKIQTLTHNNNSNSSPFDHKITINGELFDQSIRKNVFNPYIRNFNVRRLNRTE